DLAQKNNLGTIAKHLTRKEVANIQQKQQESQDTSFSNSNDFENELQHALGFLATKNYQHISIFNFDNKILEQVYKFSYPIQKLMASEISAMNARIEKEKPLPNLITPKYNKLLTINIWKEFYEIFVKAGMVIYEDNKAIKVSIPVQTLEKKEIKIRRLQIGEIIEKIHDKYNIAEKEGNASVITEFIKNLDMLLNQILNMQ
ncbi:12083_t:CDS:2, partial [Dentiscutata erythropus]